MKLKISVVFLLLTFFAKAQYKLINIDDYNVAPNEPSIFISPVNPAKIVVGSNIYNQYYSADTGRTWTWKKLTSSYGVYGDPVIYADNEGNFYFTHLAASKTKQYPHWFDRIVIQKSTDGGVSFNNGTFAGFNGDKDQDKPWIVCDNHSKNYRGNIYVSWTEFDNYESNDPNDFSRIRIARSTNGALSFENAVTVSDTTGDCLDDDNTLEGATAAIGPKGEVYLAWAGHGKIFFDKSLDGGLSWAKDKVVANQDDGWVLKFEQLYRSNGLPFLVADNSDSKYKNRIYIVWGEYLKDLKGEIKLIYSDNGGETWSKEITVNSDSKGDQFLPHISVDPSDGSVYVVFYDRRNSKFNIATDVYVAVSTDGGNTFLNKRITDIPFFTPGYRIFFGDYNGISAQNGIVRPVWTAVDNEKIIIQTALLSKNLLLNEHQLLKDTFTYKYYKNDKQNTFILHSESDCDYEITLKVMKKKDSTWGKTYRKKGNLNKINNEIKIITTNGVKTKMTLKINGKLIYKEL
ncbi:MAG: exo-alpha-sialidase [Bacteroidetes bacterium]|nr:exo-alpha-sialidase [Bacteroidota bacterium]